MGSPSGVKSTEAGELRGAETPKSDTSPSWETHQKGGDQRDSPAGELGRDFSFLLAHLEPPKAEIADLREDSSFPWSRLQQGTAADRRERLCW